MKNLANFTNKFLLCCILLFCIYSCVTSFHKQSTSCFDAYSTRLDACDGDEDCEIAAVNSFQDCIGYKYVFPIHFVVLTDSLKGTTSEITNELTAIVDTLNKNFTVEDSSLPPDNRRRVVSFRYKSATLYSEAKDINSDLVEFATPKFDFVERHDFKPLVNNATLPLRDSNAINVYIVDSWRTEDGVFSDVDASHGNDNDYKPYMVLDYARINGKTKRVGAEEHEMGHCFKLAHVCEGNASSTSSTNIMSSSNKYPKDNGYEYISEDPTSTCRTGSSGKRDIGFNAKQCRIILNSAYNIKVVLGL